MKIDFVTALVLAFAFQANAAEFDKKGPHVSPRVYESSAQVFRDYEVGKSTFTLTADCQDAANEEAAKAAIAAKVAVVQTKFDTAIAALKLGARSETLNYKLDGETSSELVNPFDLVLDAEKKKNVWKNRCTGDSTEEPPVRAKKVLKVTKQISVWFPNVGQVLNDLSALVEQTEDLSDLEATGVDIACNSAGGANFDLDVSDSTAKKAWEVVEAAAKAKALEKQEADFKAVNPDAFWLESEGFKPDQTSSSLPQVSVEKKDGKWVGTFTQHKNYLVQYKQNSAPESRKEHSITGQKNYPVVSQTTSEAGLYGTLTLTVRKACAKDEDDAKASITPLSEEIRAKIAAIHEKQKASSTEQVEIKDPVGQEENILVGYRQVSGDYEVTYYYNPCTLEKFELQQRPDIKSWVGSRRMTIVSSDLNALADLRETVEKAHKRLSDDPSVLGVDVEWDATATLEESENATIALDFKSWEKFTKHDLKCDGYAEACLSQALGQQYGRQLESAAFDAAPAGAAYSLRSKTTTTAEERGKKPFRGKYVYNYTIRKVLK